MKVTHKKKEMIKIKYKSEVGCKDEKNKKQQSPNPWCKNYAMATLNKQTTYNV